MNSRNEFLLKAIEDTQATIRALDVKIGALLTAGLLPFSNIGRIWSHFKHLTEVLPCFLAPTLGVAYLLLWFLMIYILVKGLSAIDNPVKHVSGGSQAKGSFYRGGLYTTKFADAFLNRKSVKSRIDLQTMHSDAPFTEQEIELELTYEQMKLTYIREIKIKRFTIGIHIGTAWLSLAAFSFLYSKIYT